MLAAGTTLGRYEIFASLGAGGMGEVYRARDPRLGRDVAIKVLSPHFTATPHVHARFQLEARVISQLSHPHICTLYDIGREGETDYLVMELLDGETLAHRLEKGPLPLAEVLVLGAQIADALHRAHRAGVVHRDLKPGNVMLTKAGAKLMDFGLAHVARPSARGRESLPTLTSPLTSEGAVLGTFEYMAPEQLEGKEADERSDLWALGCVLYEMTTGKRPFAGASHASLIAAILKETPRSITELQPLTPPALEHVVKHCLEKDPDQRFQSAIDLEFDLSAGLDHQNRDARPAATAQPARPASAAGAPRRRWAGAVVLAILAMLAGFGIYWKFGSFLIGGSRTTPRIETLVVLQDDPPGVAANVESLGQGVVQNLTDGLCQLPGISVLSNAGAPALRQQPRDLKRIGNELGADALVTVGVAQTDLGYEVRVALIETRTLHHLWGGVYKRRSRDVADTIEGVSHDVTEALQLRLSVEDRRRLEAYRILQKARYYWDKRSAEGLRRAVDYYNEVIRIDPGFAPAYAGLANCYSLFPYYGGLSPAEAYPKAEAAARRALELDETLADAHTALALVLRDYNHDWAQAEREFKRAIELNPSYATAQQWYAEYLAALGRYDEAIGVMKRAEELAPLEPIVAADLGWVYYLARRPDDAIAQLTHTIEREPEFAPAHWFLSLAYAQKGSLGRAIASGDTAMALGRGTARFMADCAAMHARAGDVAFAETLLQRLKAGVKRSEYVSPYDLALVNIGLGRNDQALDLLEQSFRDRRWELVNLKVDPVMDSLRHDERFAKLVRRLGFPQ